MTAALPELPENLGDPAVEEDDLHAMADAVKAAAAEIISEYGDENGAVSDTGAADALVAASEMHQALIAELGNREQVKAERSERAAAAAKILGVLPTVDAPEGEGAEGGAEPVVDAPEQIAAAAETADVPAPVTLAVAPPDPAVFTAPTTAPTQEATQVPDIEDDTLDLSSIPDPTAALATITDIPVPAGKVAPTLKRAPSLRSRMSLDRGPVTPLIDTGSLRSEHAAKPTGRTQLAHTIASQHDRLRKTPLVPKGTPGMIVAHAEAQFEVNLGMDAMANYATLNGQRNEFNALVASGGNCAIATPNYDVFNAAEEQSPVEGFVRTVGAPRGGVRYLAAPDWVAAQAGVAVTTEAQDAAGYTTQDPAGPTPPKVCVHFDCPSEVTCEVEAVSACASFGNLTYRTATELVEVLLDQLAVAQAQAKEISYLDSIEAGSTLLTDDVNPYGAVRSSVWTLANAAWAYRKRNMISRNMPLDVLAPDTMIPVLKADAVNDLHLGMNFVNVDQETLAAELFDALNLNVEFYYDFTTDMGASSAMQQAQGAGSLANFPLTFRAFMYAPGTWIRLDGGVLDVGIIRDTTNTTVNDLTIFSEEWVQMCKVGLESIAIDLELCPSGEGPTPVTGLACTS